MKTSIAIIGAGASGLFTSVVLASCGFYVTLFEKNSKIGKKLLATGNGRCNISNKNLSPKFFHTNNKKNRKFIENIIEQFDHESCKEFFHNIGVEFIYAKNGRAYPMSQQSSTVVDMLEFEAVSNGVKIVLNSQIDNIEYKNNRYIINNQPFSHLIISTGSIAMPKLGGTNSGYEIAKDFGHNLIDRFSSLVQLVSENKNLDTISGVKVEAKVDDIFGDILFTKYGLSGSAILDISRKISAKLQKQNKHKVTIDLLPTFSEEELYTKLLFNIKLDKAQPLDLWLNFIINRKLARYIIDLAVLPKYIETTKDLKEDHIKLIVKHIKNLHFTIIDTKGFGSCEVVAGGVDIEQIDNNLESKLHKNLYFIGEVLDVDGNCGGYNLQWAFSSGYVCANSIAKG